MPSYLQRPFVGYAAGIFGVAIVALLIRPFYPSVLTLTAANMLLVVVLLVATTWGMRPALLASMLGALCLNYFYVSPPGSFDLRIDGSADEVALAAFLLTAVTVGQLSSSAQRRARENKRLYDQLRNAFDQTTLLEVVRRNEQFKSALLDSVTHDLRTPLTSIKAASTAMIDIRKNSSLSAGNVLASENDLLGVIVQQSDRLNHFIEGLIELASVEASGGGEIVASTPVDEIIGAAIARADDALREHEVMVKCGDDIRASVNAKAVAQVLFSILENAGKYAPQGTTVRVVAEYAAHGLIRIAVEDEGPGVPAALRGKIFEKFFRGDAGAGQASGLGVGLAIARNVVEAHGGLIWVEDREPGTPGARFVFTLPVGEQLESGQSAGEVAL